MFGKIGPKPRVAVISGGAMVQTLTEAAILQATLDYLRIEWQRDWDEKDRDVLIDGIALMFGRGDPGFAQMMVNATSRELLAKSITYADRYSNSLVHLLRDSPTRALDYIDTQAMLNEFRRDRIRQGFRDTNGINRDIEKAFAFRLGAAKAVKLGSELIISNWNPTTGLIYGLAVDILSNRQSINTAQIIFWKKESIKKAVEISGERATQIAEANLRISERLHKAIGSQLVALEQDIIRKSSARKLAKIDRQIIRLNAVASSATKAAGTMTRLAKVASHAGGALNLIFAASDAYEAVELMAEGMSKE